MEKRVNRRPRNQITVIKGKRINLDPPPPIPSEWMEKIKEKQGIRVKLVIMMLGMLHDTDMQKEKIQYCRTMRFCWKAMSRSLDRWVAGGDQWMSMWVGGLGKEEDEDKSSKIPYISLKLSFN